MNKSLYLRTTLISDLTNCTTDSINELIIDNDLFNSDADSFAIAKLLKDITNKKVTMVVKDASNHLYLVNMLHKIDVNFYSEYRFIDLDKAEDINNYFISEEKEKICLSNSVIMKIINYFNNIKIKKSNKRHIKKLKKVYSSFRKTSLDVKKESKIKIILKYIKSFKIPELIK
ncbi:MAG: hypothetical protein MR601_04150 [Erysipelotrichaceae bacterium]|nr:hypothetical protein [Erysipelotrichaceae bacterium]